MREVVFRVICLLTLTNRIILSTLVSSEELLSSSSGTDTSSEISKSTAKLCNFATDVCDNIMCPSELVIVTCSCTAVRKLPLEIEVSVCLILQSAM